jgi:hypothetical protein
LAGAVDPPCPFAMDADELFIFWAADADVGIFITLGWPVPRSVIDARVEFMRIRCGLPPLPAIDVEADPDMVAEKEAKAAKKRRKKPGQPSTPTIRTPNGASMPTRAGASITRN